MDYCTLRDKELNWGPTAYDLRTSSRPTGPTSCRSAVIAGSPSITPCSIRSSAAGRPPASCAFRPAAFLLTSGRQTLNQQDAGVILNGITVDELQKMISGRVRARTASSSSSTSPDRPGRPGQPGVHRLPHRARAARPVPVPLRPGNGDGRYRVQQDLPPRRRPHVQLRSVVHQRLQPSEYGRRGSQRGDININPTDGTFGQTTGTSTGSRDIQFRLGVNW